MQIKKTRGRLHKIKNTNFYFFPTNHPTILTMRLGHD